MRTLPSALKETPAFPVGHVMWWGDRTRLVGMDEAGNVRVFQSPRRRPTSTMPLRGRVARWIGGAR